jgi:HTH-type transcriptional regulator/antitoxin HigA
MLNDDVMFSPGQFVQDALEEKKIKQKELSLMLGKSASVINDIIKDKRTINAEIAVLLEAVTDIDAAVWMNYQSTYTLLKAQQDVEIIHRRNRIKDWFKIESFVNVSILKKQLGGTDIIEFVDKLLSYAGVQTAEEFCELPEIMMSKFRKSEKMQTDVQNLFTWTLIARHKSNDTDLPNAYDPTKIEELSEKLNEIFYRNEMVEEKVETVLNHYGIKYLKIRNFEKTPVDGYSFWEGSNPTIVVSRRYDRLDNYAFNIFHELGHITLHMKQGSSSNFLEANGSNSGGEDRQEREANEFAKRQLSRGVNLDRYFSRWSNTFAVADMLKSLSMTYRINLGIITGQYQNYCSNYTLYRHFLEKID